MNPGLKWDGCSPVRTGCHTRCDGYSAQPYLLQDLKNDGIGMISVNHPNLLIQHLPPLHKEKQNEKKTKWITKLEVNKKESSTRRKKEKMNKFLALQKMYCVFLTNLN